MKTVRQKAGSGAASNGKSEHRQGTHSGFKEKAPPDRGERKLCSDVNDEVRDEQRAIVFIGCGGDWQAAGVRRVKCCGILMNGKHSRQDIC